MRVGGKNYVIAETQQVPQEGGLCIFYPGFDFVHNW